MPFVNEMIAPHDREKYDLDAIDRRCMSPSRSWTIDRERDIYLRYVGCGREEFCSRTDWTLCWHGDLIWFSEETLAAGGPRGGAVWAHKRLLGMRIPAHLENEREAILAAIREALTAYKDAGVHSTAATYSLTLDA